ncbi:MAG: TIGR03826 family flagellar region protein [Tepidanaerobacteraceae bacterium]|jgi:flagellar operon protein (TIGR03826 family)|nr:MerR family transcriptional regulator [Thermoanaerobacterales bacterium]
MKLKNCPQCGKLFIYSLHNLCPDCIAKDEDNYNLVRDYLYDNPNASVDEISEKTGVPSKNILEYLKEGRLILKKNNINILLSCERCNEPILSGRFCEKCAGKLKNSLSSSKQSLFLDKDRKGKIHLSKFSKDRKR